MKTTHREEQILHLMAEMHTYKDISKIIGIKYRTVEDHIYNLYRKTGVNKKELLIKYALEHGYGKVEVSA
jgi:DNA-binding CsgD family transcriptional regulator